MGGGGLKKIKPPAPGQNPVNALDKNNKVC